MSMSVPLAMEAVTSDVKTQRAPSTAIARLGMAWDQDCNHVLVSSLLVSSKDVKLTRTFPLLPPRSSACTKLVERS